ncbi:MAG: DUF4368 domain-containing protein [Limnochordia bacterium]
MNRTSRDALTIKIISTAASAKAEKIDGRRTQRIQVFYNCIGAIDLPN